MWRWFSIVGAIVVWSLASAVAAQDDREQARSEFARGVQAYEAQDFRTALEAFQEAYRLRPHPTVRVNMANCYDHLDRPLEALVHFEAYLRETGRDAPRDQRREVERAIQRLRDRIGVLTLHIAPDGAIARIDDGDARRAPISEPLRLAPGPHRIEVRLDGFRTETREVVLAGGQQIEMNIALQRGVAAASASAESTPDRADSEAGNTESAEPAPQEVDSGSAPARLESASPRPIPASRGMQVTAPVAVIGTVSALVGIGAIVSGVLAVTTNGDFNRQVQRANNQALPLPERLSAQSAARDAANTARTAALTGDILGATAVVGVVTTAVLFFSQAGVDSSPPAGAVAIVPAVSPDLVGVTAQGSF